MAGAVPPPPPPPPPPDSYILLGRDGRQHQVRLETLRAWAAEGSITAAHQVFSHTTETWNLAGELPELRDVLQASRSGAPTSASMPAGDSIWNQKFSGCGCVVVGGAILLLIVIMAGGGNKSGSNESAAPASEAPPPQARQLGSGDRAAHMNQLVSQLSPLLVSWQEVGPASVHVQMSPRAWNGMSRDEQQQLMDELASKQIVRDIGATIHFRVRSTEVGTIGPGWSGEYRFRRTAS